MTLTFRPARESDVEGVIALLADDKLGTFRERKDSLSRQHYIQAFQAIEADSNNELIVVFQKTELVGTFQLSFIPSLTHSGGWRAEIEGVRVASSKRGQGLGKEMMTWAIARSKEKGCGLVQLTSDKQRPEAHRFYESLGFTASHTGFKLKI